MSFTNGIGPYGRGGVNGASEAFHFEDDEDPDFWAAVAESENFASNGSSSSGVRNSKYDPVMNADYNGEFSTGSVLDKSMLLVQRVTEFDSRFQDMQKGMYDEAQALETLKSRITYFTGWHQQMQAQAVEMQSYVVEKASGEDEKSEASETDEGVDPEVLEATTEVLSQGAVALKNLEERQRFLEKVILHIQFQDALKEGAQRIAKGGNFRLDTASLDDLKAFEKIVIRSFNKAYLNSQSTEDIKEIEGFKAEFELNYTRYFAQKHEQVQKGLRNEPAQDFSQLMSLMGSLAGFFVDRATRPPGGFDSRKNEQAMRLQLESLDSQIEKLIEAQAKAESEGNTAFDQKEKFLLAIQNCDREELVRLVSELNMTSRSILIEAVSSEFKVKKPSGLNPLQKRELASGKMAITDLLSKEQTAAAINVLFPVSSRVELAAESMRDEFEGFKLSFSPVLGLSKLHLQDASTSPKEKEEAVDMQDGGLLADSSELEGFGGMSDLEGEAGEWMVEEELD